MVEIININNKNIAIKGLGRAFYESGFPISVSISELAKEDIQVSILHIADEFLKNGWSPKTTFNKLKEELENTIHSDKKDYDFNLIKAFCYESYENQRSMIFKYLFNDAIDQSKLFVKSYLNL